MSFKRTRSLFIAGALLACLGLVATTGCGGGKPDSPAAMEKTLKGKVPASCKEYTKCESYRCYTFCMDESELDKAKEVMKSHCSDYERLKIGTTEVVYGSDTETWARWELDDECKVWMSKEP